jgi:hypothetical protein
MSLFRYRAGAVIFDDSPDVYRAIVDRNLRGDEARA